jgi:hypothetical protein
MTTLNPWWLIHAGSLKRMYCNGLLWTDSRAIHPPKIFYSITMIGWCVILSDLLAEITAVSQTNDTETKHRAADDIIVAALHRLAEKLPYNSAIRNDADDIVSAFRQMDKWYA